VGECKLHPGGVCSRNASGTNISMIYERKQHLPNKKVLGMGEGDGDNDYRMEDDDTMEVD
jgi:hypothetical protein